MISRNSRFLGLAPLLLFLTACGNTGDSASGSAGADPATYETEAANEAPADKSGANEVAQGSNDPTLIREGEFLGIRPGQSVSGVNNLKKDMLKTGEGNLQVYTLSENDGRKIGYIVPGRKDKGKVGAIHILSKDYQTPAGIGVGSTFAKLEEAYGDVGVHGTEVEGRTFATAGGLTFRLDAYNTSYELEKSAIKPKTRITEIIVE